MEGYIFYYEEGHEQCWSVCQLIYGQADGTFLKDVSKLRPAKTYTSVMT